MLRGESGSGKTFLFSKIKSYLQDAEVTYVEIPHNASSSTVLGILSTLQEGAVVAYDSGDLSFDAEICKYTDYSIVLVLYSWRNCNGFMFEDNPTTPSSELLCYTFPGKYYFSGGFKELTVDCTM